MLPFELAFSYVSLVLPALRTQTPMRYASDGVDGVHTSALIVPQSKTTRQEPLMNSHHLYSYGAVPPLAFAVNVIVVPIGCGEATFAVIELRASGAADGAVIA